MALLSIIKIVHHHKPFSRRLARSFRAVVPKSPSAMETGSKSGPGQTSADVADGRAIKDQFGGQPGMPRQVEVFTNGGIMKRKTAEKRHLFLLSLTSPSTAGSVWRI